MPFSKTLKDKLQSLTAEQLRDFITHGFSDAQFKAWHNYLKENNLSPSGMNSEGNGSLHECLETFYDSLGNTQQAEDILALLNKYIVDVTTLSVNI